MFLALFITFSFGLNFKQAYDLAKTHNSDILVGSIEVKKSLSLKEQATATIYPALSASSTTQWYDTSEVPASSRLSGSGKNHTAYINLSQTLFKGGENYQLYQYAKLLPKNASQELRIKELNLYQTLATRFHTSVLLQEQVKIKAEEIALLKKRLGVLRKRFAIGRSRSAEVLNAKSQLAISDSELSSLEAQLFESKNLLKQIIGVQELPALEVETNVEDLNLSSVKRIAIQDLTRTQLEKTKLAIKEREYQASKGSLLPSIEVGANYYFDRPSASRGIEWDANLTFTWDLYSGGSDLAELRVKAFEKQIQQERLLESNRHLHLEYDRVFDLFEMRKKEYKNLQQAVSLSHKVYYQNSDEYKKGLVTNLEVLDSLNRYLDNKARYKTAEFELFNIYYAAKSIAEDIE